jgi:hypothetical protein
MRTYRKLSVSASLLSLCLAIGVISCGKKDSGDDGKKSTGEKITIQSAEVDSEGTAHFIVEGSENKFCRFETNEFQGEWYKCGTSKPQYPDLKPGQAVTLYVRAGEAGEVTQQTVKYEAGDYGSNNGGGGNVGPVDPNVLPADVIPFGGSSFQIALSNRVVTVPPNMYVVRYSYDSGLSGNLKAYEVETPDDPLDRATICQGAQGLPNVATKGARAVSTPNGAIHNYCESNPPKPVYKNGVPLLQQDVFKFFNAYQMGYNAIEMVSERNQPNFNFLSYTVFKNGKDEYTTLSRFEHHCGMGAPNVIQRYAPLRLQMRNEYFNFLPGNVDFHYCQKKITIGPGVMGTVYVGGFKSLRTIGPPDIPPNPFNTADVIEMVRISTINPQDPTGFFFAKETMEMVLGSLNMAIPDFIK